MTPRRRVAGLALVLAVTAAACGGSGGDAEPATTADTPAADTPTATDGAPSTEAGSGTQPTGTTAPPATAADPVTTEPSATEPAATEPAATTAAPTTVPVPPILDFTADLVGGGTLDASTLAARPTAFWFWAPT